MTEQTPAGTTSTLPNYLPPLSLAQLKECVEGIRNGSIPLRVGRRSLLAIESMIDNPTHAASKSIGELAAQVNVNASTLSRLARTLGYPNFSEFQGVFRRHVANAGRRFSDRVHRLNASHYQGSSNLSMLSQIANEETQNIQQMLDRMDEQVLEQVLDCLSTAPQVRVYGTRHAHPLALLFANTLALTRNHVAFLGASGDMGIGLSQMQRADCLFLIDYRPYSREALACAKLARKRHIHCIVLTDTPQSPLLAYADIPLITPTEGLYFGNNLAAPLVLLESITTLLVRARGDNALNVLINREKTYADLQFDV